MLNWPKIIGFVGSLAALVLAIAFLDWSVLGKALVGFSILSVVGVAAFSALSTLSAAQRWALLMARPGEGSRISDVATALIASAYNIFTPAAVGADVYRIANADATNGRSRVTGFVLAERFLGVICLASAYLLSYAFISIAGERVSAVFAATAAILALGDGLLIVLLILSRALMLPPSKRPLVQWCLDAASVVRGLPPRRLCQIILLSAAATLCWLACVAIASRAAGLALDLNRIIMITVATEFSRLLPLSIQGIGVREITFAWFASAAGGGTEVAFVACATAYALHFGVVAFLAIIAWLAVQRRLIPSRVSFTEIGDQREQA
jgi:glycosyltransferase 2 family protein